MLGLNSILCIVVDDCSNDVALEHAFALAKNNKASLTLVKVVDDSVTKIKRPKQALSSEPLKEEAIAEHQRELENLTAPWHNQIEVQSKVLVGNSHVEIIREVLRGAHCLVVKTAQSGGLQPRLFSSDDMQLLRKCPSPIWLVNSKSTKVYRRILAAVDVGFFYSPEELDTIERLNLHILKLAGLLSLSTHAGLDIVHALELFGESAIRYETPEPFEIIGEIALNINFEDTPEEKPDAYAAEVRQQHRQNMHSLMEGTINKLGPESLERINPETHLLIGPSRKKIPDFVDKFGVDLVVMGTENRNSIPGFSTGNTAETIFNELNCSVLAVKPPGFVSSVTMDE